VTTAPYPIGLAELVASFDGCEQLPVRSRIPPWDRALVGCLPGVTGLLRDDRYTEPFVSDLAVRRQDRTVTRGALFTACNDVSLVSAFVLVMVWGSGTTGSRGLRNTARAIANEDRAHAGRQDRRAGVRRAGS
jgi:hypothetical protein